jgi:flagellar motor component MotA
MDLAPIIGIILSIAAIIVGQALEGTTPLNRGEWLMA